MTSKYWLMTASACCLVFALPSCLETPDDGLSERQEDAEDPGEPGGDGGDDGGGQNCVSPPPGMIGWWSLDEDNGTVAHDLLGQHHGNHLGTPQFAPGVVAGAYLFDGQLDGVRVPHDPALDVGTGDWSWDAWVQWDPDLQPGSGNTLFSKTSIVASSLRIMLLDGGFDFHVHLGPGGFDIYEANYLPPAHQWTHLAVVVDQAPGPHTISFYADGVQIASLPLTSTYDFTGNWPLTIGNANGGFGGKMDEIEYFDRALGAGEILTLFEAGPHGKCKECGCAEGFCDGGSWCEDPSCASGGMCWDEDSYVSWLHCGGADVMRGCDAGFCYEGGWCEDPSCPSGGVCWEPETLVSQYRCGCG